MVALLNGRVPWVDGVPSSASLNLKRYWEGQSHGIVGIRSV
jgi:hypothetical protein